MNKYFCCLIVLALFFSMISCEEHDDNPEIKKELPSGSILDIAFDRNGNAWFVTYAIDEELMASQPLRCSLPLIYTLTKFVRDRYFIVRDPFEPILEILFDNQNALWALSYNKIFSNDGASDEIFVNIEGTDAYFEFLAVDTNDNIWAGGMNTGLFKISKGNIIHYETDISVLPSNSMTAIHIDRLNNIWIALSDPTGIMKISGEDWTIYNIGDPEISDREIRTLTTDNHKNLWIGTGRNDDHESLILFDGNNWDKVFPEDGNGNIIYGDVQKLLSDTSGKIWMVMDTYESSGTILISYNGSGWNKATIIPVDAIISDIELDSQDRIWVATYNYGYYILDKLAGN
jgi:ligand-binding sensor domain-containing protein